MDSVTIRMTTPLRKFVGGHPEVHVSASSVAEALQRLAADYPGIRGRVVDEGGGLREFIQVHVGKTPLCRFGGLSAGLKGGEVISLSSPFSGG